MHENQDVNIVSRDNINSLIQLCLQTEQDRGLSKNSIVELKRYLIPKYSEATLFTYRRPEN